MCGLVPWHPGVRGHGDCFRLRKSRAAPLPGVWGHWVRGSEVKRSMGINAESIEVLWNLFIYVLCLNNECSKDLPPVACWGWLLVTWLVYWILHPFYYPPGRIITLMISDLISCMIWGITHVWMSCTPKFNTLGLFKSIIISMSNHFNDVCLWQKPAALKTEMCFYCYFYVFTPVRSFASSGLSTPGEESSSRWSTSPTARRQVPCKPILQSQTCPRSSCSIFELLVYANICERRDLAVALH